MLLASTLELPVPVSRDAYDGPALPEGGSPTATINKTAFRKSRKAAVTPYQALPVQGPIVSITHHLTPSLPVLEPENGASKQVLPCSSFGCRRSEAAHLQNLKFGSLCHRN